MEAVAPVPNQKRATVITRVFAAIGVLVGAAGVFFVTYFNPVTAGFFPVCPLFAATGFYCPGCGMTRGFHALFHGEILTALGFNALLPFYFFFFAYAGVSLVLVTARGRGLSFKPFGPRLLYGFLAVFVVFALARNLPFSPFTYLAP